jgi:hypothetical protein
MSVPPLTRSPWRPAVLLPAAFLVVLGVLGLNDVRHEWHVAKTIGQQAATFSEVVYAVSGILAAVALLRRAPVAWPLLVTWAVATIVTSGLAPVAWGGAGILSGVAAAMAAAVVAALVLHFARR